MGNMQPTVTSASSAVAPSSSRAPAGDAAAASGHATAYLEQLRNDKELSLFDQFTFTSTPTRNPATGRMAVEFLLRLKPAAPAPGGKKS